jgi:hypothetical protein
MAGGGEQSTVQAFERQINDGTIPGRERKAIFGWVYNEKAMRFNMSMSRANPAPQGDAYVSQRTHERAKATAMMRWVASLGSLSSF